MCNKVILYVAPNLSSFVINDIKILSERYRIIKNVYDWSNKIYVPFIVIRQFFFLLRKIFFVKAIIVSSGGYWAFFPTLLGKIFKKKVFIILNGSDCASIPSIKYGMLGKFPLKLVCKMSYRFASYLLPVSSSLVSVKNTYYSDDEFSFQGYKFFFPEIKTNYEVVYNGVDNQFWKPLGTDRKESNSFISVFSNYSQFIRKGGDIIFEISKKLPDCKFYIVGFDKPKQTINNHVIFLGKLNPEELKYYYNNSQFYLQLSVFEGFGVALCEAMLCECIPIGSSVNVIPDIIGDTGFILNNRNIFELEKLIRKAITCTKKKEKAKKARQRIVNNYSFEKRKNKLFSLLED